MFSISTSLCIKSWLQDYQSLFIANLFLMNVCLPAWCPHFQLFYFISNILNLLCAKLEKKKAHKAKEK